MNQGTTQRNQSRGLDLKLKQLKKLSEYAAEDLINDARMVARKIEKVSSTQLRKFHGKFTAIWEKFRNSGFADEEFEKAKEELVMLIPYLYYMEKRVRKKEFSHYRETVELAIRMIKDKDDLGFFKKFHDAIIAYHYYIAK